MRMEVYEYLVVYDTERLGVYVCACFAVAGD